MVAQRLDDARISFERKESEMTTISSKTDSKKASLLCGGSIVLKTPFVLTPVSSCVSDAKVLDDDLVSIATGRTDNTSSSNITSVPPSARERKVRFDMNRIEFFDSWRNIDDKREWNRCWYSNQALESFRESTSKTARKVLSGKRFSFMPPDKRAAKVRGALLQVFEECRKITKEEEVNVDRQDLDPCRKQLVEIYAQAPDLVGLEALVLSGLRGEASYLCKRVLTFVDRQNQSPQTKHKKKTFFYARASQTISRASRVYVRELAKAQAAALAH